MTPNGRDGGCHPVAVKESQSAYKERAWGLRDPRLENTPGSDLLSHTVTHAVPSAEEGLTAVFEMGTGVSPPL